MKERADKLIVQNGLASSRERAKALIMAGQVFVGTQRVDKAGEMLDVDDELTLKGEGLKYVSRGGYKLEKILDQHGINLEDKICCDIGSSTGGFTDCMLQYGAKKVYAIDVGYNQLAYSLRVDPRVVVMERTNIRTLDPEVIQDPIYFISIDVSFIGLELVLPVAEKILDENGKMAVLIKPQFEAGKENVGKGGIVRDPKVHRAVLNKIKDLVESLHLHFHGLTFSPIKGTSGNVEFLMYLSKYPSDFNVDEQIQWLYERSKKGL